MIDDIINCLATKNTITTSILSTASVFGGAAISISSTNVCHSISYPLTMKFGIPHGLAAFLFIPWYITMCFDRDFNSEEFFKKIFIPLGIKYRLSEYGVKIIDFEWIAEEALSYGKIENFVKPITKEDIIKVLGERI